MQGKLGIIGAGASGLSAAIWAARTAGPELPPDSIILIERLSQPGKKLTATGNGHCNFTNTHLYRDAFHTDAPGWLDLVPGLYDPAEVISFFRSLGIEPTERQGCVYPRSMQAEAVRESLLRALSHHYPRIRLVCGQSVTGIRPLSDPRSAHRYEVCLADQSVLRFDALILAAGGSAASRLGSDGSGYRLCRQLGIRQIRQRPALTGLTAADPDLPMIAGIRTEGRVLLTDARGRAAADCFGEIQFSKKGISGIPVMNISRYADDTYNRLVIRLFDEWDDRTLTSRLQARLRLLENESMSGFFTGLLPSKLGAYMLKRCAIPGEIKCRRLHADQKAALLAHARSLTFAVTGTYGFDDAQVSAGGVDLTELDPESMMAKRFPGLYITGELADVDGICGGYNLQWAWISGMLAGIHAGRKLVHDPDF